MQVVSGPIGRERLHYEAPQAKKLPREMTAFLSWFEADESIDPVIQAGLAHLWFVTIHPFEDGNGRIARAIADMALARSEESSQRFGRLSRGERESSPLWIASAVCSGSRWGKGLPEPAESTCNRCSASTDTSPDPNMLVRLCAACTMGMPTGFDGGRNDP